jgi:hypothetical protein
MMKPNRFLTEIGQDLTEHMELEEGLPHLIAGKERNILPIQELQSGLNTPQDEFPI